jgi:recombination protein RecT
MIEFSHHKARPSPDPLGLQGTSPDLLQHDIHPPSDDPIKEADPDRSEPTKQETHSRGVRTTKTRDMNEVQKTNKKTTVRELLKDEQFGAEIATALPSIMTGDRFLRVALTTLQKVPKLQNCSQASLCQALLDCASLGLEPDNRRAHLIPYGNNVQLIVDYKGVVELVMRNGDVRKLHADIVCESDAFEYDRGEVTKHSIAFGKDRGKPIAAYCIATLKSGETSAEVMTVDEINAIRDKAKSGKSDPWVNHWGEMAKKTVFKRLSKWLPMTPEVKAAAEYGDDDPVAKAKPVVAAPVFDEADFLPEVDAITMNDETTPEGVDA